MAAIDPEHVTVVEIMTRPAITARPDTTVDALIGLMSHYQIGCVPIIDDRDQPTGIVTKRALLESRNDGRTRAREVMTSRVQTLPSSATLARAAAVMSTEVIHHLLVVDDDQRLIGVISTVDLTRWLAREA